MIDTLVVVISQVGILFLFRLIMKRIFKIIFFLGGWKYFVHQLAENYGVRNRIVILSFALTFALSCMLFELIIFEILAFLQPTYDVHLDLFLKNRFSSIQITISSLAYWSLLYAFSTRLSHSILYCIFIIKYY
jgi:hypothetical protein